MKWNKCSCSHVYEVWGMSVGRMKSLFDWGYHFQSWLIHSKTISNEKKKKEEREYITQTNEWIRMNGWRMNEWMDDDDDDDGEE